MHHAPCLIYFNNVPVLALLANEFCKIIKRKHNRKYCILFAFQRQNVPIFVQNVPEDVPNNVPNNVPNVHYIPIFALYLSLFMSFIEFYVNFRRKH